MTAGAEWVEGGEQELGVREVLGVIPNGPVSHLGNQGAIVELWAEW